jgi:hypothetical protein
MALRNRPRRAFRLGGRFGALAAALTWRLPVVAALIASAAVLVATRSGGAGASAAATADTQTPHMISVTIDPRDWPAGQPPTFRRLLSYYGLESTLLSATLAANMRGDQCPSPNAPIPSGATVLIALSHDGPDPCEQAASVPAAG